MAARVGREGRCKHNVPHIFEAATALSLSRLRFIVTTITSPLLRRRQPLTRLHRLTFMLKRNVRGSPTVIQFVLLPDDG